MNEVHEEGYSRGTGRDHARFYEYALGSAREARGWYFKGKRVLGEKVLNHRTTLLTQICKLLLTMIPHQRGDILREDVVPYRIGLAISRSRFRTLLSAEHPYE